MLRAGQAVPEVRGDLLRQVDVGRGRARARPSPGLGKFSDSNTRRPMTWSGCQCEYTHARTRAMPARLSCSRLSSGVSTSRSGPWTKRLGPVRA